ncbi:hypothetical protein GCM10017744_073570 [Streptomyces antimycoticus]|uniref:Uncharacterized protein n=1 Tax=Streptomyces antimycoticus TaxID=68175 RepID=A0A4D4K7Q3_9ACTN|nr:hypothetical protein SANT12839_028050 [Streptomyces antimycoticus]
MAAFPPGSVGMASRALRKGPFWGVPGPSSAGRGCLRGALRCPFNTRDPGGGRRIRYV